MRIKKQVVFILLILFSCVLFADSSFIVKKIETIDNNNEYFELANEVKKKLCCKLSTSEANILAENIYELSYEMYCPIILIYFEQKINLFSYKTYLCICFLNEEHNLESLDMHECNTRSINEIFVLPKSM